MAEIKTRNNTDDDDDENSDDDNNNDNNNGSAIAIGTKQRKPVDSEKTSQAAWVVSRPISVSWAKCEASVGSMGSRWFVEHDSK